MNRNILLAGAFGLLAGCATTSTGKHVQDFDRVTLAPGDTGQCLSSPCRVLLQMPDGSGSFEVTADEMAIGVYPAGELADLGRFYETKVFVIKGMEAPKTHVYIPKMR